MDRYHAKDRNPRRKNRLLAVKLAPRGGEQATELCGIARGHLLRWIKPVREQGLEALMQCGRLGKGKEPAGVSARRRTRS